MNNRSKDQKFKHVIKDINGLTTADAVLAYIAGDDRQDVIDAATLRIAELEPDHPFIQAPPADDPDPLLESFTGGAASPESPEQNSKPPEEEFMPTHDKDTTGQWVKTLSNLQPKQGEIGKISEGAQNAGLKGDVGKKTVARKNLTIRDGKPQWILFDENGNEIGTEQVPGH